MHDGDMQMDDGDMQMDAGGMDMGNAVTVGPDEIKELAWRFDEGGELLYGCHESGHYEGGMVGTISVTAAGK